MRGLGGLLGFATGHLDLGAGDWQPPHRCRAGRDDRAPGSGFLINAKQAVPTAGTGETRLFPGEIGFPYRTRAGWGCPEPTAPRWPPTYSRLRLITVHHTAMPVSDDAAADVRAVYEHHAVTRNCPRSRD